MTITTVPTVEVTSPPVNNPPGGLFGAVAPQGVAERGWQAGVWWRSVACEQVGITYGVCTVDNPVPDLVDQVACGIATGAAFTVYARSLESMGGMPVDERVASARDLLMAGEQFGVEKTLWALMLAELPDPPEGTATDVREAVAVAEAQIRALYAGQPVFHMSPYAATLAIGHGAMTVEANRLRTALRSDAVAGAGYGTPPTASGQALDVIATGQVVIVRGEVTVYPEARNMATNGIDAMAMRTYVVGWDCTAVRVHVPATP